MTDDQRASLLERCELVAALAIADGPSADAYIEAMDPSTEELRAMSFFTAGVTFAIDNYVRTVPRG